MVGASADKEEGKQERHNEWPDAGVQTHGPLYHTLDGVTGLEGADTVVEFRMNWKKITTPAVVAGLLGTITTWGGPPAGAAARHTHYPTQARFVPRGPGKADVSLNVNHAPIGAVLRLLFRRGGQSYVLGPFVSGVVTLTLHHVPFDTALDRVLSANSVPLRQSKQGRVYVIRGQPSVRASRRRPFRRH